jgi:hypothetical protein
MNYCSMDERQGLIGTRYFAGHIRETGLDEEESVNNSSSVDEEVTAAAQAEAIAKFWLHDRLSNHRCGFDQSAETLLFSRVKLSGV